jgi:cyanophycin synthetase
MMQPLTLRVTEQRLLPGFSAGLAEPTALVSISVGGSLDHDALVRVRAGVDLLCPDQPLFGISESDWPTAFLVDPGSAEGTVNEPLGQWVVALTVALQRWARDPVWRGRVLDAEPHRLRLAIPWRREGLLNDTLRLALHLLELWAQPPNDGQRGIGAAIEAGMQEARLNGLPPGTLRSVQAAVSRGIPFDVLPSWVQFGWGEHAEKMDQSFTGRTGLIAAIIAKYKMQATRLLAGAGIPVPTGEVVADFDHAQRVASELGWPVVIKPADQELGRGVEPDIRD